MGVSGDRSCNDEGELREQLAEQLDRYRQPILVERFIRGREVTVGVDRQPDRAGGLACAGRRSRPRACSQGLRFLPPLEVDFAAYPESEGGVYTNRMKTEWAHDFHYSVPAPLDAEAGANSSTG